MRSKVLCVALFAVGCGFTEVPPPAGSVAINSCDEDNPCNEGTCNRGMCVANRTLIQTLLVEVTPPNTTPDMGGKAFFARLDSVGGDIAIGPVGTVTGSIVATVDAACQFQGPAPELEQYAASEGTIPADLTFVPSERVLGVAATTYVTASGVEWRAPEPYQYRTSLPPGDYDIYVEPRLDPEPDPTLEQDPKCLVPPFLIRRKGITGNLALSVELPTPTEIQAIVRGPAGDASMKNWSAAVLDAASGRVLSAPFRLGEPKPSEFSSDYEWTMRFVPAHIVVDGQLEVDQKFDGHEVIRLSPPPGVVAPSFFFERSATDVTPGGPPVFDLAPVTGYSIPASPLPGTVTIQVQTVDLDTNLPVEAAVTLTAESILGVSPSASFITTVQVGKRGLTDVVVPPGEYLIRAVPPPSFGLAAAETKWGVRDIPGVAQGGKTIPLPRASRVTGEAFVSGVGGPAFGATANAVVSPLTVLQTDVLRRTLDAAPALPRTSADLVDDDGAFVLDLDPGQYDFFVRPEGRSRYAWLVSPQMTVPAEGELKLPRLKLPLPYVYHARVVVDDDAETPTRVPGALIRAYAYVTIDGQYTSEVSESAAVIPVAEARTDENGEFELLIPASLDER
jgi:hypothetical protein